MGHIKNPDNYISDENYVLLLNRVCKVLENLDAKYWITFGTLLGYLRDGKRIPWDNDIDITVSDFELVLKNIKEFQAEGFEVRLIEEPSCWRRLFLYNPNILPFHIDLYEMRETKSGCFWEFRWTFRLNLPARVFNRVYKLFLTIADKIGVFQLSSGSYKEDFREATSISVVANILQNIDEFFNMKRAFYLRKCSLIPIYYYGILVYMPECAEEYMRLIYGTNWNQPNKTFNSHGAEFIKGSSKEGMQRCYL